MAYTSKTLIFNNGVLLLYDVDYHIVNNDIIYEIPIGADDKIEIIDNTDDVYSYIGNGSKIITADITITKNTYIFLNGVKLTFEKDYTYNGTEITFINTITTDDYVIIIDNTTFDLTYTKEITTNKDTNINIPYYVQMDNNSLIFLNGIKVNNSDFTLNTTTNIITFNYNLNADNLTITGIDVSSNTRVPTNLMAYKPKRYQTALCWEVNATDTDNIDAIEYKVEIDVADTFDTINLKTFTKDSAEVIDYQNGKFFKAFIFNDLTLFSDQEYYFRVCALNPYASDWSESYKFQINKVTWYEDTENINNLLPDNYVYTKVGYTKTKKILELYMRLIGDFKKEYTQISNNFNYAKIQDEDLYNMLGILLNHTRSNASDTIISYKYELLNLWNAFLKQGTVEALNTLIKTFYGVLPTYTVLKNTTDIWKVYDTEFLLSISSTAPMQEVQVGDSYYNTTTNKIVTATQTTNSNILDYINVTDYPYGINNIIKDSETNKIWITCDNGYLGVTDNEDLTDITYYRLTDENNNAITEDIYYFGFIKGYRSGNVIQYYYYAITNTKVYFYRLDTTLAIYRFTYHGVYNINKYIKNSVYNPFGSYDETNDIRALIVYDGINQYIFHIGPSSGTAIPYIHTHVVSVATNNECKFCYGLNNGDEFRNNLVITKDTNDIYQIYWSTDLLTVADTIDNVEFSTNNIIKVELLDESNENDLKFGVYTSELIDNTIHIYYDVISLSRTSGMTQSDKPLFSSTQLKHLTISSDYINDILDINLIGLNTYLFMGLEKSVYTKLDTSTFYDTKTIHTNLGQNIHLISNNPNKIITYNDTDKYTTNLINLDNIQNLISIQNAWEYFKLSDPKELTRYISNGISYYYNGTSLIEGTPTIPYIWYVYEYQQGEEELVKPGDEPYTYTMPYLASNIVLNVNNSFNVNIDQTIIMQFIDMLKPLNVNILLNIITPIIPGQHYFNSLGHYNEGHYYNEDPVLNV